MAQPYPFAKCPSSSRRSWVSVPEKLATNLCRFCRHDPLQPLALWYVTALLVVPETCSILHLLAVTSLQELLV